MRVGGGRLEKPVHGAVNETGLAAEEAADRTCIEVNEQRDPFPEGERHVLPLLDQIGRPVAVIYYLFYPSHLRVVIALLFADRPLNSPLPGV